MASLLFNFIFFGCFGIAAEVIFTAVHDLVKKKGNLRLQGHSYVWMFPIYGMIAFVFPPVYVISSSWNLLLRLAFYAFLIYVVEFITGFILEKTTGTCPWDYTKATKYHVKGYIRLDYAPLWMGFAFLIELMFTSVL